MQFAPGNGFSIHSDVLTASPNDPQEKVKLVEELKLRAKNSIKYGNLPEAIQLYGKGIEIQPENAILYANRSMCHLTMGNGSDAVSDGQMAVTLDPTVSYGKLFLGIACTI